MKKSEITNQDLLQAIQKVDQKIDLQKQEILAQVDDKIDDVLFAVNKLSTDMDKRLNSVDNRLEKVEDRLGKVETRLSTVEATINTQVVKKTDLEEAFATFEYKKVNKLTNLLQQKKILNQSEAQAVLSV